MKITATELSLVLLPSMEVEVASAVLLVIVDGTHVDVSIGIGDLSLA